MVVTGPGLVYPRYGRPSTLRDLQEADRAGRGSGPARPCERARRVREARGGKEAEVMIAAGSDCVVSGPQEFPESAARISPRLCGLRRDAYTRGVRRGEGNDHSRDSTAAAA